jgi:hypothetical protein
MLGTRMWETAYLAMSVVLGEPLEVAAASLPEGVGLAARAAMEKLSAGDRKARAVALAQALAPIAADCEKLELSWS